MAAVLYFENYEELFCKALYGHSRTNKKINNFYPIIPIIMSMTFVYNFNKKSENENKDETCHLMPVIEFLLAEMLPYDLKKVCILIFLN